MNRIELKKMMTMSAAIAVIAVSGCAALETLPEDKLSSIASALENKSITSVSNVRSVGDVELYDATASDGTVYSCSLQVVLGVSSQHEKCEPKK